MPADVFSVLANPIRRRLLERLREGPESTGALAELFDLGRPAVSEHLAVLRDAGLVALEHRGRHRYYHLQGSALGEVDAWLRPFEHYWSQRLDALGELLDEEERE